MAIVGEQERQLHFDLECQILTIVDFIKNPRKLSEAFSKIITNTDITGDKAFSAFVETLPEGARDPMHNLRDFYLEEPEKKAYIDKIGDALNHGELRAEVTAYIREWIKDQEQLLRTTERMKQLGETMGGEMAVLLQEYTTRARTMANARVEHSYDQLNGRLQAVHASLKDQITGVRDRVDTLEKIAVETSRRVLGLEQELDTTNKGVYDCFETLEQFKRETKSRFDALEGRFDILEGRFDALVGRFDILEGRFDTLEGRFDTLEGRFDTLEGRFDTLEATVNKMSTQIQQILTLLQSQIAEGEHPSSTTSRRAHSPLFSP